MDANCGNRSASSGTRPASRASISDRLSAAPMIDAVGADRELAQLLDPVDADGQRGPGVPDVQLDAPVGGPGHQPRVRIGSQQVEGIGQAGRAYVAALRAEVMVAAAAGAGSASRASNGSSASGWPSA